MCVLAIALGVHPRWPVVLAGNRDERHDRAAAPLARWRDSPKVLGGLDLVSGGSWLGVSEEGRLAVVTNVRGFGPPDPARPSRGLLVSDVLTGEGRYARPGPSDAEAFNPMNLITIDKGEAAYLANRPAARRMVLRPGLYGMANGGLDDGWPKTDRLKAFVGRWLDEAGDDPARLLAALGDEARPKDELLPATGLTLDQERNGSAIFIRGPVYGTRCSSVVVIGADGDGRFIERRFDEDGRTIGETTLSFNWPR